MEAIAGENLKDLFTEKWQDLFSTLSHAFGFTLSVYDETGSRVAGPHEPDILCTAFRNSSPELRAQCQTSCPDGMRAKADSAKPEIFKCPAKMISFRLPVPSSKAFIVGKGSFPRYEDFREFMNLLYSLSPDPLSISMPRVFTTEQDARKAMGIVADSVNHLFNNSKETIALRRKFESLMSVLSGWGDSAGEHPEELYRDMLEKLSSLLDIDRIAILTRSGQQSGYAVRYMVGARNPGANDDGISAEDQNMRDLLAGMPFVVSSSALSGGAARPVSFFPIRVNNQIEAVLRIEDRILDHGDAEVVAGFCRQAGLCIENHRLRHDVYKKFKRFAAISELTTALTSIQNDKALLQLILDKSGELLKAEQGSLMVLDQEADVLLVQAKRGIIKNVTEKLRISRGEGIAGRVAELGEPFLVENLEKDPRIRQKNRKHYKTPSFLSVPLKIDDRIIGVLNLADKDGGEAFNEEDLKLTQSIAAQAAIVMERNIFYNKTEELKKLTITDELTGLLNRRYLYERLKDELARSARHGHQLSLLMLDLDGFKTCNDTRGHPAGDKTLKDVSEILVSTVRSMDVVARYGGDEFMIILSETGKSIAIDIAERIRRNISKKTFRNGAEAAGSCPITASIGIACYPDHARTVELLLTNVDAALYRAKNKGKNSIEVFS